MCCSSSVGRDGRDIFDRCNEKLVSRQVVDEGVLMHGCYLGSNR